MAHGVNICNSQVNVQRKDANLGHPAELLQGQDSPITSKQINYLQGLLFGGMGSFNDLFFDPRLCGEIAHTVNDRLDKQRRALFDSFKMAEP